MLGGPSDTKFSEKDIEKDNVWGFNPRPSDNIYFRIWIKNYDQLTMFNLAWKYD